MLITSNSIETPSIRQLVLIGGGGLCREIVGYLTNEYETLRIGIIDKNPNCEVLKDNPQLRFVGRHLSEIHRQKDTFVMICIGDARRRQVLSKAIQELELPMVSYIHPTAYIAGSAILEDGVIACPFTVVNSGVRIGKNALINVHCTIGHGAQLGECSVLSPYCSLSGDSTTGVACFLGTRATLFPKVSIGDNCVVDSHTVVRQSVGDNMIVSNRPKYIVVRNRLLN